MKPPAKFNKIYNYKRIQVHKRNNALRNEYAQLQLQLHNEFNLQIL